MTKKHRLPGFVADSYLSSAYILANQLLLYIDENKPLDYLISPHHLIYPLVFNFKNGIELWLKNLQTIYLGDSTKTSHDLVDLVDSLILEVDKNNGKNKKLALEYLHRIKEIILPYYDGSYLGAGGSMPDRKNESERYPESKSPNVYCPADLLSFRIEDHKKVRGICLGIKENIEHLKKCFAVVMLGRS